MTGRIASASDVEEVRRGAMLIAAIVQLGRRLCRLDLLSPVGLPVSLAANVSMKLSSRWICRRRGGAPAGRPHRHLCRGVAERAGPHRLAKKKVSDIVRRRA